MRSVFLLALGAPLVLLAACSAEPDFDTKFEQRSRELTEKAQRIEAEAEAQLAAAREAEKAHDELLATQPPPARVKP